MRATSGFQHVWRSRSLPRPMRRPCSRSRRCSSGARSRPWSEPCVSQERRFDIMRAFLVGFLALAACASDSGNKMPGGGGDDTGGDTGGSDMGSDGGGTTDPSLRQDYDDTATIVGANLNVAQIAAMQASVNLSYGRIPAGFTEDTAGQLATGTGSMTGAIAGLAATIAYECHDINHVVMPCNGAEDHTRLVLKWTGAVAAANMSMDGANQKGVY